MGRRPLVLAAALLCVLAGCSGPALQESTPVERTLTPAPVPTVAAESTTVPPGERVNLAAVAATHRSVLANHSYTSRMRVRLRAENESTRVDSVVSWVAEGGSPLFVTAEYGFPRGPDNRTGHELWYDGSDALVRVSHPDRAEYRRLDDDVVAVPRPSIVRALFFQLDVRRVEEPTDGTTVVSGAVDEIGWLTDLPLVGEARNATMSARVTPAGYVDRIALGYDGTYRGRPARVRVTLSFTHVGETTVPEPAWVDNATVGPTRTPPE